MFSPQSLSVLERRIGRHGWAIIIFLILAVKLAGQTVLSPREGLPDSSLQYDTVEAELTNIEVNLQNEQGLESVTNEVSVLMVVVRNYLSANSQSAESMSTLIRIKREVRAGNYLADQETKVSTSLAAKITRLNLLVAELAQTGAELNKLNDWTTNGEGAQKKEILARIAELRERASNTLSAIEAAHDSVNQQKLHLLTYLSVLNFLKSTAIQRLLLGTSWTEHSKDLINKRSNNVLSETKDLISAQLTPVISYLRWQRVKIVFETAGLIFLPILLHLFLPKLRDRNQEQRKDRLTIAIPGFPVLLSVLLSVWLGFWLHPAAPTLLGFTLRIVTILSGALMIRSLVSTSLRPFLWLLLGTSILDEWHQLLPAESNGPQIIFRVECLGALLGVTYLLTRSALTVPKSRSPQPVEGRLFKLTLVLLVFVAMINLCVFTNRSDLADSLMEALLRSAWLVLAISSLARVADVAFLRLLRSRKLRLLTVVKTHHRLIRKKINQTIRWVAIVCWIVGMLNMYSVLQSTVLTLKHGLEYPFHLAQYHFTLLPVFGVGLTSILALKLSKVLRFVLMQEIYPRMNLSSGLAYAISTMVHYGIMVIAFIFVTTLLNFDLTKLTILVSAIGVGVGFGLQNVINNFVSGIVLLFEQPVKVGDSVQVDTAIGVVQRIGFRSTVLKTANGSEIIVPNGTLISNQVTNWTFSSNDRIMIIPVSVAVGSDPQQVIDLLLKVAREDSRVATFPRPEVIVLAPAITPIFELHAWTVNDDKWNQTRSDLVLQVQAKFTSANIKFS